MTEDISSENENETFYLPFPTSLETGINEVEANVKYKQPVEAFHFGGEDSLMQQFVRDK